MEEWRDIADFEGIYQVSDLGNVRALDRIMPSGRWGFVRRKGGPMASKISRTGQRYIGLRANGERTWRSIHRLVCEAFHGPKPGNKHWVVHFPDSDPLNNRASNVRWATAPEGNGGRRAYETPFLDRTKYLTRLTAQDVAEIRRLYRQGRPGEPGNQADLAKLFGVVPAYIQRIANHKAWTGI